MAIQKQGVVEAVSTKKVTTRFGEKEVYSIKLGGEWYNAGFQKVPGKGATVQFQYDETQYGKEMVKKSLTKLSDGGDNTSAGSPALPSAHKAAPSGKGVFPIPANDGQRSIIRQNATTNANYLLRTLFDSDDLAPKPGNHTEMTKLVIEVAREIEAYTTGDSDKEEAKRIAANAVARKAWEEQRAAGNKEAEESVEEYFE